MTAITSQPDAFTGELDDLISRHYERPASGLVAGYLTGRLSTSDEGMFVKTLWNAQGALTGGLLPRVLATTPDIGRRARLASVISSEFGHGEEASARALLIARWAANLAVDLPTLPITSPRPSASFHFTLGELLADRAKIMVILAWMRESNGIRRSAGAPYFSSFETHGASELAALRAEVNASVRTSEERRDVLDGARAMLESMPLRNFGRVPDAS
jgi:hypothetical protein